MIATASTPAVRRVTRRDSVSWPRLAWVAPPIAALLGTALPYQLAATRLIRGLTR